MAAKKPVPEARPAKRGRDRSSYLSNHALARDLAAWLTRLAKEEGRTRGIKKFTVAELLDPLLRPWAWSRIRPLLEREYGTALPERPPPPPAQLVRES